MPDAESFVAAIAANPADDLPRLVFADWLDENGDPTRAGFIRDHVRLAKLRPGTDEYKTLFRKCADTLRANLPAWIKPACDAFGQSLLPHPLPDLPPDSLPGRRTAIGGRFAVEFDYKPRYPLLAFAYSRGLLDQAKLTASRECPPAAMHEFFRSNPICDLTLHLLCDQGYWGRLTCPQMRSVRRLTILSVSRGADAAFPSTDFDNLTHLTFSYADVASLLVRSPLARQLVGLRVATSMEILELFTEYPLDDRLQELRLMGNFATGRITGELRSGNFENVYISLWSALSRVAFRPTLKRLDLTRCGMTDDGLAAFARGEEWVRLQGLKLGGNLFGDRGWSDFCRGWRTPELTYLDASRNRLTDAGAEMLARSGMVRTLRVIDLRGNRIAGRGAVALARAVAEGKLQKLLLAGNPLGKRDAATVKGLLGERVDIG